MYISQNKTPSTMKLLLVTLLFCVSLGYSATEPVNEKEKNSKNSKKVEKESSLVSKNFHSVKKWKMTIEFINGDIISKTIFLEGESTVSPMEKAFEEAEKYTKTFENVKNYNVSPVSSNSFVLLAGK